MRWADLDRAARDLLERPQAEVVEQVRQLARDNRFPALLALLLKLEQEWSTVASSQGLAACHGKLAHANGSLYAMQLYLGRLRSIVAAEAAQEPSVN